MSRCIKPAEAKTWALTDLSTAYENEGTEVVRQQLMKAGVRLAAILESDLNP